MTPIKATFLFLYCLVGLTIVGTAVSHFWRTSKQYQHEVTQLASARPAYAQEFPPTQHS